MSALHKCGQYYLTMSLLVCLVVATSVIQASGSGREDQCPPWFLYDTNISYSSAPPLFTHCVCSTVLPSVIECDIHSYTSQLALGVCAFWTNETGKSYSGTVVGQCPYVFPKSLYVNDVLKLPQDVHSLNSFLCSHLNRETGTRLCGRCANGTGPSVTSVGSQCVECNPANVLYIILLYYLPATIISFLILIFQPNVTSGSMAHYVLYCNALVVYMQMPGGFPTYLALTEYKYTLIRVILVLGSILSFDPLYFLSPSLCISSHLQDIHLPYIEIVKTLYPFMFLLLAYTGIELYARDFRLIVALWRPVKKIIFRLRKSYDPHASLVQAFSTIFFISYVKMIFLASVPFNWVDFINDHGGVEIKVTYVDPNVPTLHPKHISLIAFSVTIVTFIIVPPIVILLIYPTRFFTKLQNCLPPRVNLAIKIFVSTFQGSYKDGTNGTCDYRAFPGGLLAGIFVLILIHYTSESTKVNEHKPVVSWQILIVQFIVFTVLVAVMRPHKSEVSNNVGVCLSALLGIGAAVHVFTEAYFTARIEIITAAVLVMSLPHVVFYCYLVYRIWSRLDLKRALRRLRNVRSTAVEEQAIIN